MFNLEFQSYQTCDRFWFHWQILFLTNTFCELIFSIFWFTETDGIRSRKTSFASCPECATHLDIIIWVLHNDRIREIGVFRLHFSWFPRHTNVSKTFSEDSTLCRVKHIKRCVFFINPFYYLRQKKKNLWLNALISQKKNYNLMQRIIMRLLMEAMV